MIFVRNRVCACTMNGRLDLRRPAAQTSYPDTPAYLSPAPPPTPPHTPARTAAPISHTAAHARAHAAASNPNIPHPARVRHVPALSPMPLPPVACSVEVKTSPHPHELQSHLQLSALDLR